MKLAISPVSKIFVSSLISILKINQRASYEFRMQSLIAGGPEYPTALHETSCAWEGEYAF